MFTSTVGFAFGTCAKLVDLNLKLSLRPVAWHRLAVSMNKARLFRQCLHFNEGHIHICFKGNYSITLLICFFVDLSVQHIHYLIQSIMAAVLIDN